MIHRNKVKDKDQGVEKEVGQSSSMIPLLGAQSSSSEVNSPTGPLTSRSLVSPLSHTVAPTTDSDPVSPDDSICHGLVSEKDNTPLLQGWGALSVTSVRSSDSLPRMNAMTASIIAATLTTPDDITRPTDLLPTSSETPPEVIENAEDANYPDPTSASTDDLCNLLSKLSPNDARVLVDLLKLAVAGRVSPAAQAILSMSLASIGRRHKGVAEMLIELCITELEDVASDLEEGGNRGVRGFGAIGGLTPVTQESNHPYTDDANQTGRVRIPGAEALKIVFDPRCSTERRHDPLTIMDARGRTIAVRSGRELSDWSAEVRVLGDEIRWKFVSDGSVNGWGWAFTVYPVTPSSSPNDLLNDRTVLSRPSIDLVTCVLSTTLSFSRNLPSISLRLAAALASCAQLGSLAPSDRMWALRRLRHLINTTDDVMKALKNCASTPSIPSSAVPPKHSITHAYGSGTPFSPSMPSLSMTSPMTSLVRSPALPITPTSGLAALVQSLPEMLLRQFEHEDPIVRGGKHLLHSPFFKVLVALACDLRLDTLSSCTPSESTHKWAWFRRYCMAYRVATALEKRMPFPQGFCADVKRKIAEIQGVGFGASLLVEAAMDTDSSRHLHESNEVFKKSHDEQLLLWLNRRPEDWTLSWGGSGTIYGWGHNHRGQLGGVEGAKVKQPFSCDALAGIRPVQLIGGEQTLFAVTADGKVYATGYGAGGRLGIGGTDSVATPTLLESIQHVVIKKVAVNSGGKHCLALSSDGEVYSWGEAEDAKLGHGNRTPCDRPRVVETLRGKEIVDIAAGGAHSACISSLGELYTWGKGRYGRLGHGDSEDQTRPKVVEALRSYRVLNVACGSGDAQTLCITDDDSVWSWGDGDYGKLGRGGSDGCKTPMRIETLQGQGIVKVECGSQFSVALSKDGTVFTWGKGDYHRLGHGTDEHVRRPRKVQALVSKRIVSLATGSLHCVACTDQGEIYTWGDNDEGQLGDGTTTAIPRPRLVSALQGKKINKVACGSAHTLAWSTAQPVSAGKLPCLVPMEYNLLSHIPIPVLQNRLILLHHFSDLFCPSIPMFDLPQLEKDVGAIVSTGPKSSPDWLSQDDGPQDNAVVLKGSNVTTGASISTSDMLITRSREPHIGLDLLRGCLVSSVKEIAFKKVVQATMVRDRQHGPVIELNRLQVKRSRHKGGLAGTDGCKSVFGQMCSKMTMLGHDDLLLPHRVWKVKFVGESVDDCGGGYSESIAEMCDELQNGSLPLLIVTPNGRDESGANRDCFLLNPQANSTHHMNMFRFLGILMGIAIRTGSPLALSLAEPVWKQLAGMELNLSDLTEVDRDYVPGLLCIRDMPSDDLVAMEMPFSTPSSSGADLLLAPSSQPSRHVTPRSDPLPSATDVKMEASLNLMETSNASVPIITTENRHEYIRQALDCRLHEFDQQMTAVREGMARVIPVPLLSLFTGYELEMMVCGSPDIHIDKLKSVATYKGVEAKSSLITWFWEVMEELTDQERSLFLRFVWGRTRLPRTAADFRGRDFVLQVLDKYNPPDHFLPESYTCFFLLKMPRYSCKEVLKEKLKYAIHFCKSIDTDDYARIAMTGDPVGEELSEDRSVSEVSDSGESYVGEAEGGSWE